MKKRIIFLYFLTFSGLLSAQEQPQYNLYNIQPDIINPAAMGSFDRITFATLFNTQLTGFNGNPYLGMADVVVPFGKTNAIVGIHFFHDRIGVTNRSLIQGSFAYRIKLNPKNFLSFGIAGNLQIFNADFSNLPVNDPNDPIQNNYYQNVLSPNVRIGTWYFRQNFYFGMVVGNLLNMTLSPSGSNADIGLNGNDMHFYLQSGYQVKFAKEKWMFQPSVMARYVMGSPFQFDVNMRFVYKNIFGFGGSYRSLDQVVALLTLNIKDQFTIAYASNFGLSNRRGAFFTGHEIMLQYKFKNTKRPIGVSVPHF